MIADCGSEPIRGGFVKNLDPDDRALVRHTRSTLSGVCVAHRTRGASPVSTSTQVFFFTSEAIGRPSRVTPVHSVPSSGPPPVGSRSAPRPLLGSVPGAHHGHPCGHPQTLRQRKARGRAGRKHRNTHTARTSLLKKAGSHEHRLLFPTQTEVTGALHNPHGGELQQRKLAPQP